MMRYSGMYLPMIGARFFFVSAGTRSGRRDERRGQRARAGARASPSVERADGAGNHLLRRARVLRQVGDDHLHRHRVVIRMPAVVVGDERDRRVADLGFARELRFLEIGHPDDVHAPLPIQLRLGLGRELRPFHADVGAAAMHLRAGRDRGVVGEPAQVLAERMRERDVADEPVAEERADAAPRPIEELIGNHADRAARTPLSGFRPRSPTGCARRRASSARRCSRGSSAPRASAGGRRRGARETRRPCPRACQSCTAPTAGRRACRP